MPARKRRPHAGRADRILPRAHEIRGFTLIEMLVAVGCGADGRRLLARARVHRQPARSVEQETTELAQLVRRFAQMESDLSQRLPDIALPARATTPELPLAVAIGSGANAAPSSRSCARSRSASSSRSRCASCTTSMAAPGAQHRRGRRLVLPKVARFEVRVNAGGFWLDAGQAQAMQPAVRPFTRAGAIEIMVDDREGARYVKVLAL